MTWSIYVLRDPSDGRIRYVGWTSRPLRGRLRTHVADAVRERRDRSHRAHWIRAVIAAGAEPTIHAIDRGTGDGWTDAERRWIERLRAAGADLVNGTDGGDGAPGRVVSNATRAKMAASRRLRDPAVDEHIAAQHRGRKRSAATRAKIAAAKRRLTQAQRERIAAARRGRRDSDETRRRKSESRRRDWAEFRARCRPRTRINLFSARAT